MAERTKTEKVVEIEGVDFLETIWQTDTLYTSKEV